MSHFGFKLKELKNGPKNDHDFISGLEGNTKIWAKSSSQDLQFSII